MKQFVVETSARHVHVTREALDILYGKDYQLTRKKDLSQPGQFACAEKVTIINHVVDKAGVMSDKTLAASILGPERPANQVELSFTDARTLGLTAPIRESGDIAGTPGVTLKGPAGEVVIDNGVIIAKRHIHMTPEDAAEMGVKDKDVVKVKVDTARPLIFDDVVVRVSPKFALAMHIDTDECNAAAAFGTVYGEIVK